MILSDNLALALRMAIREQREKEKSIGYTRDSG